MTNQHVAAIQRDPKPRNQVTYGPNSLAKAKYLFDGLHAPSEQVGQPITLTSNIPLAYFSVVESSPIASLSDASLGYTSSVEGEDDK